MIVTPGVAGRDGERDEERQRKQGDQFPKIHPMGSFSLFRWLMFLKPENRAFATGAATEPNGAKKVIR